MFSSRALRDFYIMTLVVYVFQSLSKFLFIGNSKRDQCRYKAKSEQNCKIGMQNAVNCAVQ